MLSTIMFVYSIFALALLAWSCEALVPDLPRATQIQDPCYDAIGFSPKPTVAPKVSRELFHRRDFLANSASYVLIAPDNTCGYVSGLPGAYFECQDTTNCVFFPATGSNNYGAVGCCTDPLKCWFRTACVDSKAFYGSGCTGGCQLDIYTMKCTSSNSQYCGSIRYAVSGATVEQYYCSSVEISTWQTAYTTFNGGSSFPTFTSVARAVLLSAAASASTSTSSKFSSLTSSSSTSTSPSKSTTILATGGPTAPAPDAPSKKDKSNNTGAIVGGLLGGAAVLGLIGAGAFFLYKRKFAKRNMPSSPANAPINNLGPMKTDGNWPQDRFYSPQNHQPQPYLSSFQTQYHPVPVEMDSDFVQRSPPARDYAKSATTPTTTDVSNPMNQQHLSPTLRGQTVSEIDSNPAVHR